MRCRAAAVILLTNVLALDAAAQSKQAEPLQTTVEEVVLDLIVRDKSGTSGPRPPAGRSDGPR